MSLNFRDKPICNKTNLGFPVAAAAILSGWYFAQKVRVPKRVFPVEDFLINKYLGRWYEIGRIDFFFERGLTSCMADYSLSKDGAIQVINSGYDPTKKTWKASKATAKFIDTPNEGALKVSFLEPFYSGYFIVHIDEHYQNAVVVGDKSTYCWILSRATEMDEKTYKELLCVASANGVDIKQMHRVRHDEHHAVDAR